VTALVQCARAPVSVKAASSPTGPRGVSSWSRLSNNDDGSPETDADRMGADASARRKAPRRDDDLFELGGIDPMQCSPPLAGIAPPQLAVHRHLWRASIRRKLMPSDGAADCDSQHSLKFQPNVGDPAAQTGNRHARC
jgi:hypothetical protein